MEDSLGSGRQIPLAFKHKCSPKTLEKRNAACSESQKHSPLALGLLLHLLPSLPEHPVPWGPSAAQMGAPCTPGTHGRSDAVLQLGAVPLASPGYAQLWTSCYPVAG